MSVTLDLDEAVIEKLPLKSGDLKRDMRIELACRYYAKGWLSLGQAARLAELDRFALGEELAARDIPRQYDESDLEADLKYAGRK